MDSAPSPSPTFPPRDGLPDTAWTLGWASLVALVVPPGLVVAPLCGLLATVFGAIGMGRTQPGAPDRERALIGMVLGLVTVAASVTLIVLFHHAIGRVIHDVNFG